MKQSRKQGLALLTVFALAGSLSCDRANTAGPPATASPSGGPGPSATTEPATSAEARPTPDLPPGAEACGELDCLQFDAPEDAFRHVLAKKPVVLAIGESHAQKGKEGIPSSAKRFTDTFLPFLQGKASDLVVELMAPNPTCKKTTKEVRKKHEPVTQQHAATAQNEYVSMGERARALGIVPDLLRPSCEDLDAINKAGDDAIPMTLETIARLTTAQVQKLLSPTGRKPQDAGKMIVTYGGVLHNDPHPTEVRAPWSYGPAFVEQLKEGYVVLDIFVPEFIENTEVWRALPWFAHYDIDRLGDKTTLFKLPDQTFVLVFPRSGPSPG
jgi:hypothetical protein